MQPFCANCYKRDAGHHCGKCGCRYCSRECQVEHWKTFHKQWCGKAGQWGRDFEIKPSPDKQGVGMFALRDFKKYDVIAVERQATIGPDGDFPDMNDDRIPPGWKEHYEKLAEDGMPNVEELLWKVDPVTCRVNHDCVGNARKMTLGELGPHVLKAVRDISTGEEICHAYTDELDYRIIYRQPFCDRIGRRYSLKRYMNFECGCPACTDPAIDDKRCKMRAAMEEEYLALAEMSVAQAKEYVGKMLALADELGCAPPVYYTFYEMLHRRMISSGQFKKDSPEAMDIAAKLYDIGANWYGPDWDWATDFAYAKDWNA